MVYRRQLKQVGLILSSPDDTRLLAKWTVFHRGTYGPAQTWGAFLMLQAIPGILSPERDVGSLTV